MPILSRDEVQKAGQLIAARLVAELIEFDPGIKKAIDRIPATRWHDFVTVLQDEAVEFLLNKFGSSG